jgi:5'-3' exonuclease
MGIPSYFSYIIKNYTNIIRKFKDINDDSKIDHLMMDCNSIIYDAFRIIETLSKTKSFDSTTVESQIITNVLDKIKHYIQFISPTKSVFITFDGVAPFAKMSQQRTRRYKTEFSKMIDQENSLLNDSRIWNTTAITPGTTFMNSLTYAIHSEFAGQERKYNIDNMFISCSDEPGEGEHKLFEKIRNDISKEDTIAIYGLDSDLIMLSIFHIQYAHNIYVFREVPEFKSILPADHKFEQDEKLFLDIQLLHESIFEEMGSLIKEQSVYDYIFMCFLLGNDFLPHFPCLNIRTNGIRNIMSLYKQHIGKYQDKGRGLVSIADGTIQWINVKILFNEIANQEHRYLLHEYTLRDKMDGRIWADNTPEEKAQLLLNTPIIYRQTEKYINPKDGGWENRYYKTLFHLEKIHTTELHNKKKEICINYLEGLEWVFKYYTVGCPDWKWKYHYSYPPLFKDLVHYIPSDNKTEFILPHNNNHPFSPYLQLAYVLPGSQLTLLPNEMTQYLRKNHYAFYPADYEFLWAFCRYFWEAHPILPEIKMETLEELDAIFLHLRTFTDISNDFSFY